MLFLPRGKGKKNSPIGTPQGQQTLISLLVCTILGMILSRIIPFLMLKLRPTMPTDKAEDAGVLIALVISGIVLVVMLLKRPSNKRGTASLSEQFLKGKSDGK